MGFKKHGRHYVHSDCKHLFIEFPGTIPLGIGDDYTITPDQKNIDGKIIKILSPTDSVKDRLASYIYYKDRDCLDQAIMVAEKHPVKFESIKKWCIGEYRQETFDEFMLRLKEKKKKAD